MKRLLIVMVLTALLFVVIGGAAWLLMDVSSRVQFLIWWNVMRGKEIVLAVYLALVVVGERLASEGEDVSGAR